MSVSLVSPRLGRYTEQQSRTHSWPGPISKHTRSSLALSSTPSASSPSHSQMLSVFSSLDLSLTPNTQFLAVFPTRNRLSEKTIDRPKSERHKSTQKPLFPGGNQFFKKSSSGKIIRTPQNHCIETASLEGLALFITFCRHLFCIEPKKAWNPLSGVPTERIQMKTTSTPF